MSVSGDIALTSGTGGVTAAASQDIESAFGLGDPQGSVYVRGQADFGVPVVTLSGFQFDEKGEGMLESTFGGLSASTPVNTELEFANVKISCSFDIDLGPIKLSPGILVDVFDLHFKATETTLGNSEEIDELVPVPMLFLRGQADLPVGSLIVEVGYLDTPEKDNSKGRFFDLEAMVECNLSPMIEVFAGYRRIDIGARGETDVDSFDVDLTIDGWMIGGGVRF